MAKNPTRPSHVQIEGCGYYDETVNKDETMFMFSPDLSVPASVGTFRRHAVVQQMSDGTVEVISKPRNYGHAKLIKKVPHGRLSITTHGKYRLTLTFDHNETGTMQRDIYKEAIRASEALDKFWIDQIINKSH